MKWEDAAARILPLIALAALISCASARAGQCLFPRKSTDGLSCRAGATRAPSSWIEQCTLPAPGQNRIVRITDPKDGSPFAFRLTRLPDEKGKTRVEIAVPVEYRSELSPDEPADEFFKQTRAQATRERVVECLRLASPRLRGPDGEQITLKLAEPSRELPPARVSVRREPHPEFISNAREYANGLGCHQLLHETLHLLGLIDEYQDAKDPEILKCYAAKPAGTILSDPEAAWALSYGGVRQRIFEKRGVGNEKQFRRLLGRVADPALDDESTLVSTELYAGPEELAGKRYALKEFPPKSEMDSFSVRYSVIDRHAGDGRSLLRRGHLKKLLYPNCGAVNRVYDDCTRNTFLTEAQIRERGCPTLPKACEDPSWIDQ